MLADDRIYLPTGDPVHTVPLQTRLLRSREDKQLAQGLNVQVSLPCPLDSYPSPPPPPTPTLLKYGLNNREFSPSLRPSPQ